MDTSLILQRKKLKQYQITQLIKIYCASIEDNARLSYSILSKYHS